MKVYVYWNLHNNCFSIKALDGRWKGKVVAHASQVLIREAEYYVNQKGRERVIENKRKEVHAGVKGQLESFKPYYGNRRPPNAMYDAAFMMRAEMDKTDRAYIRFAKEEGVKLTYNPYRDYGFVERDSKEGYRWLRSAMALLGSGKIGNREVIAFDPCYMS